jgi:hypothetical protein
MKNWSLLLVIICTVSLAACTTNPSSPTIASNTQEPGYPSPPIQIETTSYPSPTIILKSSNANLTPDPALGKVTGKILFKDKPMVNMNLYLGKVLTDDKGVEFVTSLNPSTDPTCITDVEGNFSFINVPSGRYGLIVDNSSNVFLLLDPTDSNKAMLLTIDAGTKIDLGTLSYTDLPLP